MLKQASELLKIAKAMTAATLVKEFAPVTDSAMYILISEQTSDTITISKMNSSAPNLLNELKSVLSDLTAQNLIEPMRDHEASPYVNLKGGKLRIVASRFIDNKDYNKDMSALIEALKKKGFKKTSV